MQYINSSPIHDNGSHMWSAGISAVEELMSPKLPGFQRIVTNSNYSTSNSRVNQYGLSSYGNQSDAWNSYDSTVPYTSASNLSSRFRTQPSTHLIASQSLTQSKYFLKFAFAF